LSSHKRHFRTRAALVLAILLATGMGYYYFALLLPRVHTLRAAQQLGRGFAYGADLYPIWLTGRALVQEQRDPYTPGMTREIQVGLYGRALDSSHPGDAPVNYRTFAYPLYADLLALPLLPLSFLTVQIVLAVVLPLLVGAMVLGLAKALNLGWSRETLITSVLLCLSSYPVLEAMYALQPAVLVGAVLAALALALVRNRLLLAGSLLAIATIKPQMILLLALWLLLWSISEWRARKSLLIGFVLTLALLLMVCEWMLPAWWREWWHVVAAYRQYTVPPLAGLLLGQPLGFLAEAALLGLAAIVGWRMRHEQAGTKGFWLTISLILTVTVMVLPTGDAVYDQLALLLPVLLLCSRGVEVLNGSRPLRVVTSLAVGIFLWQFIAASVISVVSLVAREWSPSHAVLLLPIRTAASFPAAIFAIVLVLVFFQLFGRRASNGLAATVRSAQDTGEGFPIRRG